MGFFKPTSSAYSKPRVLTASAARVPLNDRSQVRALLDRTISREWQAEAWDYYDTIGEIKYAFGQVGAIESRVRIYAGYIDNPNAAPVPIAQMEDVDEKLVEKAEQYVAALMRGSGASNLMASAALNLQVVGECYLANLGTGQGWRVYSTSELTVGADGSMRLHTGRDGTSLQNDYVDPTKASVGRVWRPHPRYGMEADSSMRALISDCEELLLLKRMVRSSVRSRMNAGILFVPDALSVAARITEPDMDNIPTNEDTFESELSLAMSEPVSDESSASAVVPLLIRGPSDLGDKVRHIAVSRDVSAQLQTESRDALDRILTGLDVPKEIISGLAGVKYANALVISDSMYKATIEPMAVLICDAITEIYLLPMLRAAGFDPETLEKVVTWYDPSEVVTRPDPSASANEGYDRKLLSADAWRAAHGFGESDAPDADEITMRLALDKAQIPQEMAAGLLRKAFPETFGTPGDEANAALQELDSLLKAPESLDSEEEEAPEEEPPPAPAENVAPPENARPPARTQPVGEQGDNPSALSDTVARA